MNPTVLICGQCMKPAERGRGPRHRYDEADRRDCACDAELIEVEARVDPYEAFAAHRVYIEHGWAALIEACERKRAEQRRGERAYLYRDDGLHWNEADRRARWAAIKERKARRPFEALFSAAMKDKFIGPIRDQLNRQAFGSGLLDPRGGVLAIPPGGMAADLGLVAPEGSTFDAPIKVEVEAGSAIRALSEMDATPPGQIVYPPRMAERIKAAGTEGLW